MSLLPSLSVETGDTAQANFLSQVPRLNLFANMAHAPALARAVATVGGEILYKGLLEHRVRELAILRVGHLAGCAYEVAQHERIGREVGLTEQELAAVQDGSKEQWGADELLAILWAEQVSSNGRASEELVAEALQRLGPARTVELAFVVGYYGMLASFLMSFEVESEESDAQGGIDLSRRPPQLD